MTLHDLRDVRAGRWVNAPEPERTHPFGALLRSLRLRIAISQNQLSQRAGIDSAYTNRLERAKPDSTSLPSRKVVLALAEAVEAPEADTERLLVTAGHCPESIVRAGRWEPVLGEIVEVMADSRLTTGELEEFRDLLRIVTAKWRPGPRLVREEE